MKPVLRVRRLPRENGIRWPFLIRDGIPLILPNLWVDELASRENTAEAYLRDVLLLYQVAADKGFSPEERFKDLKGFSRAEIRSISARLCTGRNGKAASKATCSRRRESIGNFLKFGFQYFIDVLGVSIAQQAQANQNIKSQVAKLNKAMEKAANQSLVAKASTSLTKEEMSIVESVMHPESELNPFKEGHVRIRNYCIFCVLQATGPRKSEAVLLEWADVQLDGSPTIVYKPPSANNKAKRRDDASFKTDGRAVPICASLAALLAEYLEYHRHRFTRRGIPSTAFFLSTRDGRRLSSRSINQMFAKVMRVPEIAALNKRLHPHGLRATAMNQFRRGLNDSGRMTGPEANDALAYVAGWKPGSQMVAHYTRASILERLAKIMKDKAGSKSDD